MDSIQKLTDLFSRFPTIGRRTAGRFVSYLISLSQPEIDELLQAITDLRRKVKRCAFCFNPHEHEGTLCPICANPSRELTTLCLVEKEADLTTIESAKRYRGLYFILGANPAFRKTETEHLRLDELTQRLKNPKAFGLASAGFSEVICATNPTPEGRRMGIAAERTVKELGLPNLCITHLAQGLPVGGELEYADEETLGSAFEGRK